MVRQGLLRSRVEVTNAAILEAVGKGSGQALLDLGCGEGWLAHRLSAAGWKVLGVDGVDALVRSARSGPGEFLCAGYGQLETSLADRAFSCVVANFSLLGEDSTEQAIQAASRHLEPEGRLLVQTLHPLSVKPYLDGWRREDWSAMGAACAPQPWFFRTLESWIALLTRHGFCLLELREPRVEQAEQPSSMVLVTARYDRMFTSSRAEK